MLWQGAGGEMAGGGSLEHGPLHSGEIWLDMRFVEREKWDIMTF